VLSIHMTITTLDEKLARLLEPRAPRPALRLEAVRKLSEGRPRRGSDREAGNACIDRWRARARPAGEGGKGCRSAGRSTAERFFLTPSALQVFLPFLEQHFPLLAPLYREQFAQSAYLGRAYKDALQVRLQKIRERYGWMWERSITSRNCG